MNSVNFSPSFGSTYKYQLRKSNLDNVIDANNTLQAKLGFNLELHEKFSKPKEIEETNIFAHYNLTVNDKYDQLVESILKQKNIRFDKITKEDALKPENIYKRIVMPEYQKDDEHILAGLDTEKFDKIYQKAPSFYISKNGETGTIGNRYNGVKEFLKTGQEIEASQINLREDANGLQASFTDGRHRYAVMRDLGMKKIKFSMDMNSYKLAHKYGLV